MGNWEDVAEIPVSTDNQFYTASSLVFFKGSIWVALPKEKKIARYDITKDSWSEYVAIGDFNGYAANLFTSREGDLWAYNIYPLSIAQLNENNNLPFLARYDEKSDEFIVVSNRDGLFNNIFLGGSRILEDNNSMFWMFTNRDGKNSLLSFDPQTAKVETHIQIAETSMFPSLTISPDGSLWFADVTKDVLMQYIPSRNELHERVNYSSIEDLMNYSGGFNVLFFDMKNTLWVENMGWFDLSIPDQPIWYKVSDSSAFVVEYPNADTSPHPMYGLARASSVFQSSNKWLWFNTSAGLIRLDDEGWCLITTDGSPITEDDKDNIWIAAFGKLYKYYLP
jgi:ligand-binding sensor domain-containing protein